MMVQCIALKMLTDLRSCIMPALACCSSAMRRERVAVAPAHHPPLLLPRQTHLLRASCSGLHH